MNLELYVAFGFGVLFVVAMLVIAIAIPKPTPQQFFVFRSVLAIALAGVAAMVPGVITLDISTSGKSWLRAGGALAVFVTVYLVSPARLMAKDSRRRKPK